jgi:hypothetical protein
VARHPGRRQTRRHLRSSPISSAPSACISGDARCTRRWRFGRRQRSFLAGRRPGWTSRAADKIVYSKSREAVSKPKTSLEREFHPQVVRELKAQSPLDISGLVRPSPPTRSGPASSTSIICSSCLLCLAEARRSCSATYL